MATVTRGFKYRMYPNTAQKDLLARSFGCARFVWNTLLAASKEHCETTPDEKHGVTGYDFINRIPDLKLDNEWLKEVSNIVLQQKALDLGKAYSTFFIGTKRSKGVSKANFPKFKNKYSKQSIRLVGPRGKLKDGEFYLPKTKDPIKIQWSRDLPSEPTSCTISKTPSGEYYISFTCECDPELTNGEGEIGIDLGLTDFVVMSDGTRVMNPRHFVNTQRRLARAQRQHARKQKGSKNREKSRIKVAKLHHDVANQRKDFLHKLTRKLVNENQVIGIETLNVKGMSKNRSLAKHIGDVGWGKFREYLTYKASESGHTYVVSMHLFYLSSHLCSVTDKRLDRKLTLDERKWDCPFCQKKHDRDINAAVNILKRAKVCIEDNPIGELLLIDEWKPSS